ncbi:MAG TPA: chromate resistance protein ChrB domain-containing protein [Thermoanaerobaculia bacterium]|nr:chromate resistance protein ChrB domain-containing protein [Thermoanaerobaculia bacterium]
MWLLLIHQLPPKPDYLRAKIGRRLQRIGALTIKNTVYLLPSTEQTLEDFEWTAAEIRSGGGEANVFEARFVDGLTDGDAQKRFNDARDADYAPLIEEARALRKRKKKDEAAWAALRNRAAEIERIDFFGAPNGQALSALLDEGPSDHRDVPRHLRNRTWVTRAGVHVDRIASAWFIRRFIDAEAKFRFVTGKSHKPARNEIRFDMFEAEFTHEGNRCTFEVLMNHVRPSDRALRAIAEIVHDIDLKEERFRHAEGHGVAALIDGITLVHRDDVERIARASDALDDLYAYFQRK